jgi:hypothetical protein
VIPDPLTFLIRVGAAVVEAYHAATVIAAEAILSAVADLADHLPGDNAEQRLGALGLACVGVLTLTTVIAVLAVALGVCL